MMKYVVIKNDTLAAVIVFVLSFIIADVLSTVLVLRQFGPAVIAREINLFVQLLGIQGLVSMKLGIMIFLLGLLVVFSRYQASIGDILVGLAVAGAICGASNFYFLSHGYTPSIGPIDALFLSGLAINIALLRALRDVKKSRHSPEHMSYIKSI